MAFFNEFPHTRTYDSDLGWIIKEMFKLLNEFGSLEKAWEELQKSWENILTKEISEKITELINDGTIGELIDTELLGEKQFINNPYRDSLIGISYTPDLDKNIIIASKNGINWDIIGELPRSFFNGDFCFDVQFFFNSNDNSFYFLYDTGNDPNNHSALVKTKDFKTYEYLNMPNVNDIKVFNPKMFTYGNETFIVTVGSASEQTIYLFKVTDNITLYKSYTLDSNAGHFIDPFIFIDDKIYLYVKNDTSSAIVKYTSTSLEDDFTYDSTEKNFFGVEGFGILKWNKKYLRIGDGIDYGNTVFSPVNTPLGVNCWYAPLIKSKFYHFMPCAYVDNEYFNYFLDLFGNHNIVDNNGPVFSIFENDLNDFVFVGNSIITHRLNSNTISIYQNNGANAIYAPKTQWGDNDSISGMLLNMDNDLVLPRVQNATSTSYSIGKKNFGVSSARIIASYGQLFILGDENNIINGNDNGVSFSVYQNSHGNIVKLYSCGQYQANTPINFHIDNFSVSGSSQALMFNYENGDIAHIYIGPSGDCGITFPTAKENTGAKFDQTIYIPI